MPCGPLKGFAPFSMAIKIIKATFITNNGTNVVTDRQTSIASSKCIEKVIFYRVRQIPFFFLENALKKTTEYFLKFFFLFECTILPVNNEK